ncbi:MAG: DUF2231 domain-containing protein [Ignavibacteria bacterium]|jgi:uncharacterized membrane protein
MQFLTGLHPLFVHFPIALYIIYVLFEITGLFYKENHFTKAAQYLLFITLITDVMSALTGNQATGTADHLSMGRSSEIKEHESTANIFIWFVVFLFVGRTYLLLKKKLIKKYKIVITVVSLIGLLLVFETADHGGKLVYKFGVGTDLMREK